MEPRYDDGICTVYVGDCLVVLGTFADDSVDAVVTDPPYGLGFMGKDWDSPGGVGNFPMRRFDALNTVNTGASRQGGRQRSTEDFAKRQARDARSYQEWCEQWARECLRVLKPGGHLLAFGGTRTYHRLASAIEDAGFELRDSITWLYGSGFPKSLDVSKAIDKAERGVPQGSADPTSANHGKYRTTKTEGKRWEGDKGQSYGAGGSRFLTTTASEKTTAPITPTTSDPIAAAADAPPSSTLGATASRWQGWGTALKPASEPIVVARKSLAGTVAANVQAHGTGALNIDGCRVDSDRPETPYTVTRWKPGATLNAEGGTWKRSDDDAPTVDGVMPSGRWPTNVVLDEEAADALDAQTGVLTSGANPTRRGSDKFRDAYGDFKGQEECEAARGAESGGASRFYPVFRYEAKAGDDERPRVGNVAHPTVKPVALMRWLVRLVTPPEGLVLDPFLGSGTTAEACVGEGVRCIGIEREEDYMALIEARLGKGIQIGLGL